MRALLGTLVFTSASASQCGDGCGKRGTCTTAYTCLCESGFQGADCTERTCPIGRAWQGYTTETDNVHDQEVECSNMGMCDRSSGKCACHAAFEGKACERLKCPENCNGHGKCRSLGEAAAEVDNWNLLNAVSYNLWDKDMIHGCVCDKGWSDYDCSKRECIKGDDPATLGGSEEVQVIECTCAATASFTGVQGGVSGTVETSDAGANSAIFTIHNTGSGAYTFAVTTAGSNYDSDAAAGDTTVDKIVVLGTTLGGATPANDCTLTVTGAAGAAVLSAANVAVTGTPPAHPTCSGGVVLDVYGEQTTLIAHDASAADMRTALRVSAYC